MFDPTTLGLMPSVISLPESASGATPCASQDGQMTDLSGPAPALANLSARQAKEQGLMTSGTYGLLGITWPDSIAQQLSLANKLQALLASSGSTLFRLTWKARGTPSQRQICALRASALRTSDSDCTSWPTPIVNDSTGSTHCYAGTNPDGSRRIALKLPGAAQLASWPTPLRADGRGSAGAAKHKNSELPNAVRLVSGDPPIGFPAATEKPGQLNPAHSRWLMGLPPAWDACAPTGMPSSRKSRKRS